jgi:hypothetical protein
MKLIKKIECEGGRGGGHYEAVPGEGEVQVEEQRLHSYQHKK